MHHLQSLSHQWGQSSRNYTDMQEGARAGHVTPAVAMVADTVCVSLGWRTDLRDPNESASGKQESGSSRTNLRGQLILTSVYLHTQQM